MRTHLTWRSYLQSRTRRADFLWRMVLSVLAGGFVIGLAVDWATPPRLGAPAALAESGDEQLDPDVPPPRPLSEAAQDGDWSAVWWGIPHAMQQGWRRTGPALLAALTGLC
ncbi:MAG: hypothetical protein AAF961_05810, partial [Planctomycetota bacterium]